MEPAETVAAERLLSLSQSSALPLAVEVDARGVGVCLLEPKIACYHSFVTGVLARRASQPGQALLRACNNKNRGIENVLDLTAGWGADSLTLARRGQRLTMLEHNTLIHAILAYSLHCLAQDRAGAEIASRMKLENTAAETYLQDLGPARAFDCIYLDPMFPPRKSSAKPGAEMQLLQAITENRDIEACFNLARAKARRRVVVKRPLKAPALGEDKPDMVYREKSIRFDVYLA